MKYILCEYANKNKYNAGNKARSDVIDIAAECGYTHIPLFKNGANKIRIFFQLIKNCLKIIIKGKKNDDILIQYPYYPLIVDKALFKALAFGKKIKHYKLTIVIHDVMALRNIKNRQSFSEDDLKQLTKELKKMKCFDKIICHNNRMLEIFKQAKPDNNYVVLGIFDYLYSGNPVKNHSRGDKYSVIIAGNLSKEKCGYIYKLPALKRAKFNLYGVGYDGNSDDSITYKGKYPPDELIEHLEGDFGLVWDGDEAATCSGVYGQYLKYNNPHKFSLYIASGLPVIVWKRSALADYVDEKGIGICVDSLHEIDSKLQGMTTEQYNKMVSNVLIIREDVINGRFLTSALM